MIEILGDISLFIIRAFDFAMDFSRLRQFARVVTGSDAIVEVPPDPKILPAAARRALDEAERRQSAIGKMHAVDSGQPG